jgi:Trk K+ transport system NAD-binding subunit
MPLTGSHLELIEAEIAVGTPAAGRAIGSLGLPDGAAVGGIVRKGIVVHADDDTKLQIGDRIVVLSPTKDEAGVRKALFG